MRLGITLGYSGGDMADKVALVQEAERLGYEMCWTSEAWGTDAISPAAWLLAQTSRIKVGTAIIQMQSRSPALAAMTSMTLQEMSGGRFVLGIGPSGPQVIEGWHGVPFGKPLARTREYISIIRQILRREGVLEHHGEHYDIPYHGQGATGLGKPLKTILHPDPDLTIYTAAITPAGVRTAAEVADGVIPVFMDPERDVFGEPIAEGLAKAGNGKTADDFEVVPFVPVRVGDDLEACRAPVRDHLAFYVGGMGARNKNFYNDYVARMGYEGEARKVQDLFLSGQRKEASAALPDEFVDGVALLGDKARIRDRLGAWKDAIAAGRIAGIALTGATPEAIRVVAEAAA